MFTYLPCLLTLLTRLSSTFWMPLKKPENHLWLCLLTYLNYFTYLTYAPLINLLDALEETRDASLVTFTYLLYLLTLPYLRACNQSSGCP
jgi:hypothetical protein